MIAGGGFAGAVTALHLVRLGKYAPEVVVVERTGRLGRGIAYDADPCHLLDVHAGRMSLFADEPDHFWQWAKARHPTATRASYLPRVLYGAYIEETLSAYLGDGLTVLAEEACALRENADGFTLGTSGGATIDANALVLATGHGPPETPAGFPASLTASPRYIASPTGAGALSAVPADARLLVVGSGATFLDVLLSLRQQGHRGHVTAISRHGLLPAAQRSPSLVDEHAARLQEATHAAVLQCKSLRELVRRLRAEAHRAELAGRSWQGTVDALRDITPLLWQRLHEKDRRRFLRHARVYWDTHRHRAPLATLQVLDAMRAEGRLELRAARIVEVQTRRNAFEITLRPRGEDGTISRSADWLINATGPGTDLARGPGPLLHDLLVRGELCQDPLRLGLFTAAHGAAIRRDGRVHERLFVVGPPRRASEWEAIAAPEIRAQAEDLAQVLGALHVAAHPPR